MNRNTYDERNDEDQDDEGQEEQGNKKQRSIKKPLLIAGAVGAMIVFCCGGWTCISLFVNNVDKSAASDSKIDAEATFDADPTSKKNAALKEKAFQKLLWHIFEMPAPTDGQEKNKVWALTADNLLND